MVVDREGPYYVYTPNLPGGYSVVWVNETRTDLPPPGTYGEAGDRVVVCYTDDIYAFADEIGRVGTPPTEETHGCEHDGESGIPMADGTCMTPSLYDEVFALEALAQVESHAVAGASVAEAALMVDEGPASVRVLSSGLSFTDHVRVCNRHFPI